MPAPSPNIEQLKEQAKDLLKAHKAADPRAALRLRQPSPNSTSPPTPRFSRPSSPSKTPSAPLPASAALPTGPISSAMSSP